MFRRISPLCLTLLVLALASPLWAEPATDDDGDGSPDTEDCDDTDDQNFPENSELCDGQDNDCDGEANFGGGGAETWEAVQGGSMSNSPYTKGTVMVASSTAQLSTFAMYLDIPVGSNVTLTVAEGTAPGGPFDMVAQDVVAGTGTPEFHEIAANVSLTAGMYYFFGGTWVSATGHYYASGGSSTSGWVEPEWGAFVHGAWSNGGSPPSVSWTPGSLPSGAYTIRLTTGGGGELDEDGDGSWSCEDCDDSDAGNRPGGTEVCDGQDNDCDSEADERPDLERLGVVAVPCGTDEGECTRGIADCLRGGDLVCVDESPPVEEVCDLLDNDCDGELDEAVLQCRDGEYFCDLAEATPEVCDGIDNDCDEVWDEADPELGAACERLEGGCRRPGRMACVRGALACGPAGAQEPCIAVEQEEEPNNTGNTCNPVVAGGHSVRGVVAQDGDRDWYCFQARANQQVTFDIDARVDGSSLDSYLYLWKLTPRVELARNDDSGGSLDSLIDWRFDSDGRYAIEVGSWRDRGCADCDYRLTIR